MVGSRSGRAPSPEIAQERVEQPADTRVAAVLQVLRGEDPDAVASRWSLDPALLHRWVSAFVAGGTATVTNRPDQEAATQRDRFLAAYAHEMRTPLATAKAAASMLRGETTPPAAVPGIVNRLWTAVTLLEERNRNVELLAACALGRLVVNPEAVPVRDLVEGLSGLTEVGDEGGDAVVHVDREHFPRVLRDLWRAGWSAPRPRSLRLEVRTVDPWMELRVARDADPIDPRILRALFEPFDLNEDGTGVTIGLYLARALTVAHGGTIGVDQDDQGAVLWVRVPRRRPQLQEV